MNSRISLILCLFYFFGSCMNKERSSVVPHTTDGPNPLIEAEELVTTVTKPGYSIIDFRPQKAYQEGHIPSAINIWHNELMNSDFPYGGMMPKKEQIERLLSKKGIHTSDTLILYDQGGSTGATRFWWLLNHYGHDNIRILNGGLHAYVSLKGEISTLAMAKPQTNFKLGKESPKYHIDLKVFEKMLGQDTLPYVIDVRSHEEFSGKRQKKGAKRAGAIPHSHSLEWLNTIDIDSSKKFLPVASLEKLYAEIIPHKESEIVVYCHSGARSSHTTFVLSQLLGYKNVRNYDGSWIEWSYFDQLPVKKETETIIFE